MDVLRKLSSQGALSPRLKSKRPSRPLLDAPMEPVNGSQRILRDLGEQWQSSAFPVEKRRVCTSLSVSVMLAIFVLLSALSVALVTWGVMFGLNSSGYDQLSSGLSEARLEFAIQSTNLFLESFSQQMFVLAETLRVQISTVRVFLVHVPPFFLIPRPQMQSFDLIRVREILFSQAKAAESNVYMHSSLDGVFIGYGFTGKIVCACLL